MSIQIPMLATFNIVGASVVQEVICHEGHYTTERKYGLVLRAREGKIRLTTGESLKNVDVHFTLSSRWRAPQELDRDLKPEDVGFLFHSPPESPGGLPFIHGACIWPSEPLPEALFSGTTQGTVGLTLSSVPQVPDQEEPFTWSCFRPHMIRIASVWVSVARGRTMAIVTAQRDWLSPAAEPRGTPADPRPTVPWHSA